MTAPDDTSASPGGPAPGSGRRRKGTPDPGTGPAAQDAPAQDGAVPDPGSQAAGKNSTELASSGGEPGGAEAAAAPQGQAAPWGGPPPPPHDDGEPWTGAAGELSHGLSRAMYLLRQAEHVITSHQVASPAPELNGARAAISRAMEYIENEGNG